MKKSDIATKFNIEKMATSLGLSCMEIKIALTRTPPVLDTNSIQKINSLASGLGLYERTKGNARKRAIAERTLEYCNTRDDLEKWKQVVDLSQTPALAAKFCTKMKERVTADIMEAKTFKEIHSIWVCCDDDSLRIEDGLAFLRMKVLIETASVNEVLLTLFNDIDQAVLWDNYAHYEIAVLACKYATPESALEALKDLREHRWDGEQDSYPVQLLIQKAAELYRK